jgi:hypothetical protein
VREHVHKKKKPTASADGEASISQFPARKTRKAERAVNWKLETGNWERSSRHIIQ